MHRVVIIGGGVAGLTACANLTKTTSCKFHITIVEKKNYIEAGLYSLHIMIQPSVFDETHVLLKELRNKYERNGHRVELLEHSEAVSVNTMDKQLTVMQHGDNNNNNNIPDTKTLYYDYLILANGSRYSTPYVKPNPQSYSNPDSRRLEFKEFQDNVLSPENRHVVIVGGGALGVELSGELVDLNSNNRPNDPFKITLVHSRDMLRDRSNSTSIHSYIMNFMKRSKVDVVLGHRVTPGGTDYNPIQDTDPSIKKQLLINRSPNSKAKDTTTTTCNSLDDVTMVFWCGSLTPCTGWLANSGIDLDQYGCVQVNSYLQCINHKNIFAIGDVNNAPCEKLSGAARVQAMITARNIIALTTGSSPYKQYKGKSISSISISLGSSDAFFTIGSKMILWGGVAASLKSKNSRNNMLNRLQSA
jgi:NADH dehydrogenase FAD-containing subunit